MPAWILSLSDGAGKGTDDSCSSWKPRRSGLLKRRTRARQRFVVTKTETILQTRAVSATAKKPYRNPARACETPNENRRSPRQCTNRLAPCVLDWASAFEALQTGSTLPPSLSPSLPPFSLSHLESETFGVHLARAGSETEHCL